MRSFAITRITISPDFKTFTMTALSPITYLFNC